MLDYGGRVSKRFHFSAAHRITSKGLSEAENEARYGKCTRLHGHNYVLFVHVYGPIDPETGMIIDLSLLKRTVEEGIIDVLDHGNVNEVIGSGLGTTEVLAKWIYERLNYICSSYTCKFQIELWETENNQVLYPAVIPDYY